MDHQNPQLDEPVAILPGGGQTALRTSCLIVWVALGLLGALLAIQWRARALHPIWVPFLLLMAVTIIAAIVGLGSALGRMRRTEARRPILLWAGAMILPAVVFALPFDQARRQWAQRQIPHSASGQLVIVTAAALMEAQAEVFVPRRLETDRLIMFYDQLATPQLDIEVMDQHVARLEERVGSPLRAKIHWVRGSLLGQGNCSFLGLALGSTQSPADWSSAEGYLDRHELAHAVITQQRPLTADPPMVLHEGWAESQSGRASRELAARAIQEHESQPELCVADLFGPDWYHRDEGPVYSYGGAMVDFLIRRCGIVKFVELYNGCQPTTYAADFHAVYGQSLASLEAAFWNDILPTDSSSSCSLPVSPR